MKKTSRYVFITAAVALLTAGCASSDRMVRMSGGVLDEYSAPSSVRIRSKKYQKISRELSSAKRANKNAVSGMDDTLINIWPFFFRSNAYWSVLWPFIDKDPYGFALRPLYNHEGDDYSILFPLTAWNCADGHGWAALWAWNKNGCGLVPLNWQWQEESCGGSWLFPLWISGYDHGKLYYKDRKKYDFHKTVRHLWILPVYYDREIEIDLGKWDWLFGESHKSTGFRNEWNYRFAGKRPYPADAAALDKFRQEIFAGLNQVESNSFGILPFYIGEHSGNGDFFRRYLVIAGEEKRQDRYEFDVMGYLLGSYKKTPDSSEFDSMLLLSSFSEKRYEKESSLRKKFIALDAAINYSRPFNQQKPAMIDALKALDPELKLPKTVVDYNTYRLFTEELRKKYELPVGTHYSGMIIPFFSYDVNDEKSEWFILPLLSWGEKSADKSEITILPLLSGMEKNKHSESTTVLARLGYYSNTEHRVRRNYTVFDRKKRFVGEYNCSELRDVYVLCGLFYRGRFGFNVVKSGYDAEDIEKLRYQLSVQFNRRNLLDKEQRDIAKNRELNDRWQTRGEIERLKKLIRYEELKIEKEKLQKREVEYKREVDEALAVAGKIGLKLDASAFENKKSAEAAMDRLMTDYTEQRFKEDIGNGLFFRKEKFYNGDYHWHLLGILAGGEKNGTRESTHILHLLYRYRKDGSRTERIIFPFISSVTDGENSRFSFLWRVFSFSRRNGKSGGHILFIPFGEL